MNTEIQISVNRINTGFICGHSLFSGILKLEDWLCFKASLLE